MTEYCPNCDREVKIKSILYITQRCPRCGGPIKACSLCDCDIVDCAKCAKKYPEGGKEPETPKAPPAPTSPTRRTGLTVKATVTFQRWEGDIARFNGEAEFDACDALDSLDDEMIQRIESGDPYAFDEVYRAAVDLGQIHDYDGPFEVDIDEDNLSDYLEARKGGQ